MASVQIRSGNFGHCNVGVCDGKNTFVCYLQNEPISFQLAKRLVKLEHISLVNLVAQGALIHEFVQDSRPEKLGNICVKLASPGPVRENVLRGLHGLDTKLQDGIGSGVCGQNS